MRTSAPTTAKPDPATAQAVPTQPAGSAQPAGTGQPAATAQIQMPAGDRGILAYDLMTELMGTVPGFGGRKVHVGFHGTDAFCNNQLGYVNIPALPPVRRIPTRIAQEIRGYAMHEASHLLWTDDDFLENGRSREEKQNPLLKQLWNCIEDYMIERNFLEIYPGAHKNFTATEARCCQSYMEQYGKNPDIAKDLRIVGGVALTWCRSIYFGLKTPSSQDCMNTLPHGLQQRVWDWFDRIIDVEATQDCWGHAKVIYGEIQADPFDPQDPPANPQDPHQPPQGAGQGQGGGQGAGQGGGQGGGQGQGAGQGQGSGQGAGASATGPSAGPGSYQGPTPLAVGHNIADSLAAAGIEPDSKMIHSFPSVSSLNTGPQQQVIAEPQGAQKLAAVRDRTRSTTGEVSRSLRRALKTMTRSRWRGGRYDGTRIDHNRLSQVLTGNTEIYRRKKDGERIDTAVTVLLDCSGSMGGSELQICQEMATVFNDAFSGTPIKVEILGYTSLGADNLPDHAKIMAQAIQQHDPKGHAEVRSVELYEFRGFDASTQVSGITIGNMCDVDLGGTPTGDAIFLAHERLSKRPERRHVMFVLTDGQPDDQQRCKKAIKAVQSANATIIGVGIGSAKVKAAFDDWVQINQTRELPAVMLNKMASVLLGDRFKAGKPSKPTPAGQG